MARDHARIRCSIWQDPDFVALTPVAQRIYVLLLSQPKLSLCGAIDYTPGRWASLGTGDTQEVFEAGVDELEEAGYVLVDHSTSELLVRSFVRHDGVCDSPNLVQAMWKAWAGVYSQHLRYAVLEELPEHAFEKGFGSDKKGYEPPRQALDLMANKPLPNPSAKGSRKGSPTPVPVPVPDPEPSSSTGAPADRVQAAAAILAQHDYDRLREDKPYHHVGDVEAWLASAGRRRLNLDGDRLRAIADANPEWSAEQIAGELVTPAAEPSPLDATAAAQRALMERNGLRAVGSFRCERCGDVGVVERDDGTAEECECKWKASA